MAAGEVPLTAAEQPREPHEGAPRLARRSAPGYRVPPPPDARSALRSSTLFRDLGDAALDELVRAVDWLLVPGGRQLAGHGEPGEALFVVASGRLRLVLAEPGGDRLLREVGRGEHVGELSVLTGEPWPTTVRTVRDSVLARLTREQFDELTRAHPGVGLGLARVLAWQLRHTHRAHARHAEPGTLAVVPLTRDIPLADFTAELAGALAAYGSILHLNADAVDTRLGAGAAELPEDDPRYGEVTHWMNEQEATHRLVVYESSVEPSAWARRCLRQADRVVAVAFTDAGPRDSEITPVFFDAAAERDEMDVELVLVHEDGSLRPVASRVWLSLHHFAAHHHVRMTARRDFERLARSLLGQAVGLVFGGGGARAYAHIGVLRAFEEAGIPVDRLGGTSLGALIAAQYAYGYGWDDIVRLHRETWVERRPMKDYTLPLIALLSGKGPARALAQVFGDGRIEDLWLPFFCVSTNLSRAELVVHREGPLAKWVRASIAIPGVLPPVVSPDGDLLADGAVLNNVPADVMQRQDRGPVIAVDVSASRDLAAGPRYAETPTPWQLLRADRRSGGERSRFPRIFQILVGSTLLASRSQANRVREEVDLFLTPPVERFDMFAWRAFERIAEVGYRYTLEKLKGWTHG